MYWFSGSEGYVRLWQPGASSSVAFYWDEDKEAVDRIDQWAFLPILGFELEF